mmetsp:Transcript_1044/g.1993  ORF Transcript_1044/g.1993 Transcript_1044/m.1993 type:complete len:295 (-) Transcript_1044:684-1568(-)|eukprot:CAMPEP_0196665570 /NCGR_PEP_ID=MMETSP1086-20130531/61590_1 /TAXON_ID=77921 /ORGANISM="Cyanoptyche  gloeocystis , Strain SAG4.97" /LENGTH=294 /DNA_ID=CAMNT_0042002389 /DNA_START=190 /DNA_END=1074 /DNA_ORIENTATION=-
MSPWSWPFEYKLSKHSLCLSGSLVSFVILVFLFEYQPVEPIGTNEGSNVSPAPRNVSTSQSSPTSTKFGKNTLEKQLRRLPHFDHRDEIGKFLNSENFTSGAEIGVQQGHYSNALLSTWASCKLLLLVDCWRSQQNYVDWANVADDAQDHFLASARRALRKYEAQTDVLFFPMFSTQAAKFIPDNSLDFVYLDARHDYCAVTEDINLYYPKIRPGGILAGHDYLDNSDLKRMQPDNDWGLCMNGQRHEGAVKGAVQDFLRSFPSPPDFQVTTIEAYPTWVTRKPLANPIIDSDT